MKHSILGKFLSTPTPVQLVQVLIAMYPSVVFTFPAMLQSLCIQTGPAYCYLLLCYPAAADLYIEVSQDVVTVAVVLEVHVLPVTSKNQILLAIH